MLQEQEELFVLAKTQFSSQAGKRGYYFQADGEYHRLKDAQGQQVGIIYDMHDGFTTSFDFHKGQELLSEQFSRLLSPDLIKEYNETPFGTAYYFHRKMNTEEVAIARNKIVPVDSNVVVIQGEYAVVKPGDPNSFLSTFALASCRGMLIYDLDSPLAGLVHVDKSGTDLMCLKQVVRDMLSYGASIQRLAFIGSPHIDPMHKEYVINKLFTSARYDLPTDFSFDLRNRSIVPFNISDLSDAENLNERVINKLDVLFKHHIAYINSY